MMAHDDTQNEDIGPVTYVGRVLSFLVWSRPRIATAVISSAYIVVSVSDPGDDDVETATSALCDGVLRLQFDGVDPQHQKLRGRFPMTEQDAGRILDFVRGFAIDAAVPTINASAAWGSAGLPGLPLRFRAFTRARTLSSSKPSRPIRTCIRF